MSASIIEEDPVTPWVGPTCCKNIFSVVVLSSNLQILEKLADSLTEVHSKGDYGWKLKTVRCTNPLEIMKDIDITGNVAIDFVVIALDTSKIFCLEWAKLTLAQLHPDLLRRRVVLVNAGGLAIYDMAVDAGDLLTLQDELNLDLLNANVYKSEEANSLADRLLRYLEVSVGVKTGIPNLNL